MNGATIEFHFETTADERRFLTEYLADEWEQFRREQYWKTGWFWSYRQFAEYDCGPDGGLVRLVFEGEVETFVENEKTTWNSFDGLLDWSVTRYDSEGYESLLEQQKSAKGAVGGEWEYRLKPLVASFSLTYLNDFEEPLPPVGTATDDNPIELGIWSVLHNFLVQTGYDWYDETAVFQKALQSRLKSIAAYRGAAAAREEYERLRAEWDAFESELEKYLAERPTGHASEP